MRPRTLLLSVLAGFLVSCVRMYPAHTAYLGEIDPSYMNGYYRPAQTTYRNPVLHLSDTLALLVFDTAPMESKVGKLRDHVVFDTLRPVTASLCRNLRISTGLDKRALYTCRERAPATVMYAGTLSKVFAHPRGGLSCEVLDTVNSLWYTFNVMAIKASP